MSKFVSVAVGHRLPDGRHFVSDEEAAEYPEVRAFVARFPNYYVRAEQAGLPHLCGWVGPIEEPQP